MTSKVKKELTYLIPFTQKRKLQLLACIAIMLSTAWLQGSIEMLSIMGKKIILNKAVYTDKELNTLIGTELKSRIGNRDDVLRTSKLVNGTKITISLNELDNSDNLEDGRPSKTLFTYYVTDPEYFTHFEPAAPQYKKLKNETITSLTLIDLARLG